jgi:hypothetical protein
MRNKGFLAILVLLLVVSSGCAARSGGRWVKNGAVSVAKTVGPTADLILTIDNGGDLMIAVYENGTAVATQGGQQVFIPPRGVVARGYPTLFPREIVVTIKGICPSVEYAGPNSGCVPGSVLKSESRRFQIYGQGRQRAEYWHIPENWR